MKKRSISILLMAVGAMATSIVERKKRRKAEKISGKYCALFYMMNRWVRLRQDGKNLSSYFEEQGYRKIAVYGIGYVGETFLAELKNSEIDIAYGIDRRESITYSDLKIISPDMIMEDVDMIVVTAIDYFEEIEEKLKEKMKCPIISLEDIIFNVGQIL